MIDTGFGNIWKELKKAIEKLQKENVRLKKQIKVLNTKNKEQQQEIERLKQEINAVKIATEKINEEQREELKKIIDLYICEIDECIALIQDEQRKV